MKTEVPENALVHLAWWRDGDTRNLIFGWVEILPHHVPRQIGHPFLSLRIPDRKRTYIYVARFPMLADEASTWFSECNRGNIALPTYPGQSTLGDGASLLNPPQRLEPDDGSECVAMRAPFLPSVHGAVFLKGLYGTVSEEIAESIGHPSVSDWLNEQIFFDLREYPEYLGSLIHVRYDSVIRHVEMRLLPRSDGANDQILRLLTWPKCTVKGIEVLAIEKRPLGLTQPLRVNPTNPVVVLPWARQINETAIAIIHPQNGLCWWSNLVSFVRAIVANTSLVTRRKSINVSHGEDLADQFEVEELEQSQKLVGEIPDTSSFTQRSIKSESTRQKRALSAKLGVIWLDDPVLAAAKIRSIIGKARDHVMIIDPYSAGPELLRFALAVTSPKVSFELITSAEHLKTSMPTKPGPKHEVGDMLEEALKLYKQEFDRISIRVMQGSKSPVHDRFLVSDGRVWLSGNSLNALGERASLLVELPDPSQTISKLEKVRDEAIPFELWLTERRKHRTESDPS